MKRKILSLALALIMIVSVATAIPVSAVTEVPDIIKNAADLVTGEYSGTKSLLSPNGGTATWASEGLITMDSASSYATFSFDIKTPGAYDIYVAWSGADADVYAYIGDNTDISIERKVAVKKDAATSGDDAKLVPIENKIASKVGFTTGSHKLKISATSGAIFGIKLVYAGNTELIVDASGSNTATSEGGNNFRREANEISGYYNDKTLDWADNGCMDLYNADSYADYQMYIPVAGMYRIYSAAGSTSSNSIVEFSYNDVTMSSALVNTGANKVLAEVEIAEIELPAGLISFRLKNTTAARQFHYNLRFEYFYPNTTSPTVSALTSTKLSNENWSVPCTATTNNTGWASSSGLKQAGSYWNGFSNTFTIAESGHYDVILAYGTKNSDAQAEVAFNKTSNSADVQTSPPDSVDLQASPPATGSNAVVGEATLGTVYLNAGENTVETWLKAGDSSSQFAFAYYGLKLIPNFRTPEAAVDLSGTILLNKDKTMYLNTTNAEVTTSTDYGDDYVILKGGNTLYDEGGYYLTQPVNVKEIGYYGVTISYARSTTTDLWAVEVMATSTGKFTSRQLAPTGSIETYKSASLGYIYLEAGSQEIRIKGVGKGTGYVASVTFTKDVFTEDLAADVTTIATGAGNLVDQNNVYTKANSAYDYTSFLRGAKSYVTVGIYTDHAGKYDLSMTYRTYTTYGHVKVWVNGVMEHAPSLKPKAVAEYYIDTITLKKGFNEIKIQGSDVSSEIQNIVLARKDSEPTSLAIENAEGERMPYTVAAGITAYASATISKTQDSPETYILAIAQYSTDPNIMEKAEITEIDMSEEALNSTKKVRLPLEMTGSGGHVKAFLWDGVTYEPLLAAESYEDKVDDIFPPEFVKSLLSETEVEYVQAESLTDENGNAYTGYELHNASYDIDGIFYNGSSYDGKVFAYIGIPKNASENNKVPAVVLVHGGGGTAFRKWVKLWNDRGYAAIAMDLNRKLPQPNTDTIAAPISTVHPYAGEAWTSTWGSDASCAMYNQAIDIIKAHTLISNHPYVDETKTAIMGISWGGVRTNIVIGLDDRFEVAVPVYGTGYLDKSHTYFGREVTFGEESIYMDPANFAAKAKMPVLMICSDTDVNFSINTNSLTASVIPDSRLSIKHEWAHSHPAPMQEEQIYDFINEVLEDGEADDIAITSSTAKENTLSAKILIPEERSIASATMYYLSGGMDYGGTQVWTSVDTYQYSDGILTFQLPDEAKYCYASVTDDRGHIISTKYMRIEK